MYRDDSSILRSSFVTQRRDLTMSNSGDPGSVIVLNYSLLLAGLYKQLVELMPYVR